MNILRKVTLLTALSLVMAGCASTQTEQQQYSSAQAKQDQVTPAKTKRQQVDEELSSNITFAPTINISYADVLKDIDQNIGTDVRWGGKVIESTQIDNSTIRLIVFGYPLSSDGRPVKSKKVDEKYGRFIVDLNDVRAKNVNFKGRLVTLYGDITSQLTVSNGDRQKAIPVINAKELVDWNRVDKIQSYAQHQQRKSYYGLGYRHGHYGWGLSFGYPYYGRSHFGYSHQYSPFGHFSGHRSYGHRRFNIRVIKR